MESTATIYALKDPVTGEVRYIGKTTKRLPLRANGHRSEARSGKLQNAKVDWLRTLDTDPIIETIEVVPRVFGAERERFWIDKFRNDGADLVNTRMAGRGHTEATKAKLRASALERGVKPPSQEGRTPWNKGSKGVMKPNTGTFRKGQSAWNKGKQATPKQVEKNRQGHKGKPWTEARRAAQERRKTAN